MLCFKMLFKIIMFTLVIFFGWWCQAPRRCGRWPEYGRRNQPQNLQQPSGHWCLTSHLLFYHHIYFFYSITLKYILNYILYIDVWHYIFIVTFFIRFQTIYLHIDVQLVGDAVDHVDADDADSKTWWRGQAGFHHEVDVDLREINLKTIFKEQKSTKKQAC